MDLDYQTLRTRGLIPGDQESPEEFRWRVARSLPSAPHLSSELWNRYLLRPDWVDILHDPSQLRWSEGACTDIEYEEGKGYSAKVILGRSSFLMSQETMKDHEMIHAVRCGFDDPLVEELLAWKTHPSFWLRSLSLLCLDRLQVLCMGIGLGALAAGFFIEESWMMLWGFLLVLGAFLRIIPTLTVVQRALYRCKRLGLPGEAILLHLSASEMSSLAKDPIRFLQEFRHRHPFRFEFFPIPLATLRKELRS